MGAGLLDLREEIRGLTARMAMVPGSGAAERAPPPSVTGRRIMNVSGAEPAPAPDSASGSAGAGSSRVSGSSTRRVTLR
ncbi:hypothetical protein ACWDRX_08450, partial [Streptomyces nigra]